MVSFTGVCPISAREGEAKFWITLYIPRLLILFVLGKSTLYSWPFPKEYPRIRLVLIILYFYKKQYRNMAEYAQG